MRTGDGHALGGIDQIEGESAPPPPPVCLRQHVIGNIDRDGFGRMKGYKSMLERKRKMVVRYISTELALNDSLDHLVMTGTKIGLKLS